MSAAGIIISLPPSSQIHSVAQEGATVPHMPCVFCQDSWGAQKEHICFRFQECAGVVPDDDK